LKTFITDKCSGRYKVSTTWWNWTALRILNQAKAVIGESTLMRHDWTKMVEVKLTFMTDRLQSKGDRVRYMQHAKTNHLRW